MIKINPIPAAICLSGILLPFIPVRKIENYSADLIHKAALDFLEKNKKKPFFLFFAATIPHAELFVKEEYFNSNGDLKGYKRDLYEGGIRTPMLIRWPEKIKGGSVSDHISAFWDVMPTLAEITGAKTSEGIEGISFLPELVGKKQKQHDYLYWEFHEQGGKIAVRMANWKAVKLNIDKTPQGMTELYDLSKDISETNNLSSSNPDVVRKMEEIMKKAHTPSKDFPFSSEISNK